VVPSLAVLHVDINQGGRTLQSFSVAAPWTFSVQLPAGTYTVTSPGTLPVTVWLNDGKSASVDLWSDCG